MRALRLTEFGPPSVLTVQDVPDPVPGPDEVLVKVAAAAINPSDVKNVTGLMRAHTTLPRTPGRDFAGTIVSGPGVGTEVWGSGGDLGFGRDGTHAEFLLLPRQAVCPKPSALSMEEAAAVGVPYVTAWAGLMDTAEMTQHDTVLVVGAAGAVGRAVVQIADWKGARVIGVVRREAQAAEAKAIGADDVLVSADPAVLPQFVQAATGGRGATLVFDTVGGATVEPCLRSLAPKGRLVEIAAPPDARRVSFDLLDFYRAELHLLGVNTLTRDTATGGRILQALAPGFEAGVLRPPTLAARFALEDAAEAYAQVAAGGGKVVLVP